MSLPPAPANAPVASVIAVDWSGAAAASLQRRNIVAYEVQNDRQVRLHVGHTRDEWTAWLCARVRSALQASQPLLIGLDFAFSCPAWFLRSQNTSPTELWSRHEQLEAWIDACSPPFWGRAGTKKSTAEGLRRTDHELAGTHGSSPRSIFQLTGAGAVGTMSLRGMPTLHALRTAGAAIAPFEDPGPITVVEIWPRWFLGPTAKSHAPARQQRMQAFADDGWVVHGAATSEHHIDAAAAAIGMSDGVLLGAWPAGARDDIEALEGRIWTP